MFSGVEKLLAKEGHGEVDVNCQDDQLGVHQRDSHLAEEQVDV